MTATSRAPRLITETGQALTMFQRARLTPAPCVRVMEPFRLASSGWPSSMSKRQSQRELAEERGRGDRLDHIILNIQLFLHESKIFLTAPPQNVPQPKPIFFRDNELDDLINPGSADKLDPDSRGLRVGGKRSGWTRSDSQIFQKFVENGGETRLHFILPQLELMTNGQDLLTTYLFS